MQPFCNGDSNQINASLLAYYYLKPFPARQIQSMLISQYIEDVINVIFLDYA